MPTTIKGVYDQGKITLSEEPPVHTKVDVIVTFLINVGNELNMIKRKLGGLEDKVKLPDGFNEPMEELFDYM